MSYYDSNFGATIQSPLLAGLLAESMNREANATEKFKSSMSNTKRRASEPRKSFRERREDRRARREREKLEKKRKHY